MKGLGNVAAMAPRPEQEARDVTISADPTKIEGKRNSTPIPRLGIGKSGKSAMPANPGKAPLEITNAIRRRRETSDLDYWHTLPPAPPQPHTQQQQQLTHQSPKPLYRAVLRGPLHGGDNATTLCTLSSIVDAVNDREYNMIIKKQNGHMTNGYHYTGNGNLIHNKNFSVVRAEDMGLSINGLGIAEMKASKTQTSNMTSPRGIGWKEYSSANFLKQRRQSGQNNNNNNNNKSSLSNDVYDKIDNDSPRNGKTKSKTINLQPTQNNTKPIQRSPRLCLTKRQNNLEDYTDTKRVSFSPRSDPIMNRKDKTNNTPNEALRAITPKKNGLLRQTSLPFTSNETKPLMLPENNNNNNNNNNIDSKILASSHIEASTAKRKFSNELDNYKKITKQDSLPTASSSASCIQFADSIISALTVDLNKMYSICQTKVRYAEFIESSQPHRLEDANGEMKLLQRNDSSFDGQSKYNLSAKELKNMNYSFNNNIVNDACLSQNDSKEFTSSMNPSQQSSSTTHSSNHSPKQTISNTSPANKSPASVRLSPLITKTNKYTTLREISTPDMDSLTIPAIVDGHANKDSPRFKTTRPILKSSKTDIDSNLPPFRPAGERTDSNNNASMGNNNRLVRFKVNHEVREFAPTEPVRYY